MFEKVNIKKKGEIKKMKSKKSKEEKEKMNKNKFLNNKRNNTNCSSCYHCTKLLVPRNGRNEEKN